MKIQELLDAIDSVSRGMSLTETDVAIHTSDGDIVQITDVGFSGVGGTHLVINIDGPHYEDD